MATFGKQAFVDGLKQLGYSPEDKGDSRVGFSYPIKDGQFKDRTITVGVEVPPDFNVTPPPGIHITPRLIPMKPEGAGNDRAADSTPFGGEWQYLSRPFVDAAGDWGSTTRDVKAYLRHVKWILELL